MLHTLVSLLLVGLVSAHVRWQCPTPRSDSDRIKLGPCGTNPADNGIIDPQFSKVEIQPGPLTVSFEETIRHQGSPVRIALSRESEDAYEDCILLNHVPHFDDAPGGAIYTITIDIPDVQCENCALQLIQVMTDKIPRGTNCTYNVDLSASFDSETDNCFSNYHSCANVRIAGTTPRNDYTCSQPADWPFQEGFEDFEYTKTEAGIWGPPAEGSVQLRGLAGDVLGGRIVPDRFNTPAAGCGDNIVLERTNPGGAVDAASDSSAALRLRSTLGATTATVCVVVFSFLGSFL